MRVSKNPEFSIKKMLAKLKANKTISASLPDHNEGVLQDQELLH